MTNLECSLRTEFEERFAHLIPEHMHEKLLNYVLYGVPVGHFLTAVLLDKLTEAFARADDKNLAAMHGWVKVMYGFVPSHALKTGMATWMAQGGMLWRACETEQETTMRTYLRKGSIVPGKRIFEFSRSEVCQAVFRAAMGREPTIEEGKRMSIYVSKDDTRDPWQLTLAIGEPPDSGDCDEDRDTPVSEV